ncbi:MAG TPA: hypothetical protein VIR03_01005 [Candidatus Saccharimonadales bacterium]
MELNENLKAKVANYQPDPQRIAQLRDVPILLVVGIAGAGKDTIQRQLLAQYPDQYSPIVTHTTRPKRENEGVMEQDGVEYHFIDFITAERMLDDHDYVEANIVHFDNIYGTSVQEIARAGATHKIAMADIEVKGVQQYYDLGMNIKAVFLLPPSFDVWWNRLTVRYEGNLDHEDVVKRMKTALAELEHAIRTDYFYLVINDDLQQAVDLVNQIAHGEPVEPHHHKAMMIAEQMVTRLRAQIAAFEK